MRELFAKVMALGDGSAILKFLRIALAKEGSIEKEFYEFWKLLDGS